jgi:hypothetical protein
MPDLPAEPEVPGPAWPPLPPGPRTRPYAKAMCPCGDARRFHDCRGTRTKASIARINRTPRLGRKRPRRPASHVAEDAAPREKPGSAPTRKASIAPGPTLPDAVDPRRKAVLGLKPSLAATRRRSPRRPPPPRSGCLPNRVVSGAKSRRQGGISTRVPPQTQPVASGIGLVLRPRP